MHRRLAVSVVAATSALTLLAGCGASSSGGGSNDSSAPPKTELTNAFRVLSDGSVLTTTLALDTTAANIMHLDAEGGNPSLTSTQADLIAGSRIVVEVVAPDGKTLHEAAAAGGSSATAVALSAASGGTTYFNLRDVNKTIYLQLDLKDLLGAVGKSSEYQTLVARTSSMPAFVKAFVTGQTVSVPISAITSLESLLKGYLQGSAGGAIPDASHLKALMGDLQRAILGDVTVTRPSTGATDQLVITGNARNIARDIVSTLATAIPAAASQLSPSSADQVPDKDLTLHASVVGGAVSKLSFDVGQFSPHQKDTLPVVASFDKSGPAITAPSGATAVNFQDLISFFTALGTSTSVTSSGSGSASAPTPASAAPTQ